MEQKRLLQSRGRRTSHEKMYKPQESSEQSKQNSLGTIGNQIV